jgi:nucleoside-diphosphate-sugar epimerase
LTAVLVTGAAGFVGSAVCKELDLRGFDVYRHIRTEDHSINNVVLTGALTDHTPWFSALDGIDVVVHTAARVHMMEDRASDPLNEFRQVNRDATLHFARQAAKAGVKRFIFLSSIKAMGESAPSGLPFNASQVAVPTDPYGISKYEAEKGLFELAGTTGMEVVIIRPPLVYGPGVRANFLNLIRLMQKQLPLPFGAVNNKRSLVALPNLVDLIRACLEHPNAANQVFLVSDDQDLSTPELMRKIALASDKKSLLLPVPPMLLRLAGFLTGRKAVIERLCGDLRVDISTTKEQLNWAPPVTVEDALRQTVEAVIKGA